MLFSTPIFRRGLGLYTLGTRDFFLACDEELGQPQADTSSAFGRRHEREKTIGAERLHLPC